MTDTRHARARQIEAQLRATLADYAGERDQGALFDALYFLIGSEEFGDLDTWTDVLTELRDHPGNAAPFLRKNPFGR